MKMQRAGFLDRQTGYGGLHILRNGDVLTVYVDEDESVRPGRAGMSRDSLFLRARFTFYERRSEKVF